MLCCPMLFQARPIDALHRTSNNNCERSELSGLFNGTDFLYIYIYKYICIYICIFQAVRRAVNVLNVSTCI